MSIIKLELFNKKDIQYLLDWFENQNNRRFMITKTITSQKALKLIKSDVNKKCYCIKLNKTPIGYCMLKDIQTNPKIGIMIDEKYQSKGYGKKAISLLEKEAQKLGATKLGLMVKKRNIKAINFYKKLNYSLTNHIMEKDLK